MKACLGKMVLFLAQFIFPSFSLSLSISASMKRYLVMMESQLMISVSSSRCHLVLPTAAISPEGTHHSTCAYSRNFVTPLACPRHAGARSTSPVSEPFADTITPPHSPRCRRHRHRCCLHSRWIEQLTKISILLSTMSTRIRTYHYHWGYQIHDRWQRSAAYH